MTPDPRRMSKSRFKLIDQWVDQRTGARALVKSMLFEPIPGGARWRYVWGSTLMFTFSVQMITGFFLWMGYSPSAQTAWESVNYIQNQTTMGSLLRGIHHYTAQAMIILLVLHLLQIVIDGAYKAPREFNFWIGLILMQIVLGLGLTGYLLPWDQKGYWATKVATNIAGLVPVFGEDIKRVVVGGSDYGHHTLTRFFALHAGLLPFLLMVFIGLHLALFRRHGIKVKNPDRRNAYFWPDQVLKDGVACLAVLAVVLFIAIKYPAPLMAPADPSQPYSAARPEWYFLFLYQFLKYVPGAWGALYLPGLAMGILAMMPFIGRWKLGHRFNVLFIFTVMIGAGVLTGIAWNHDQNDTFFQLAQDGANRDAKRVGELITINGGVPPAGALQLVRQDPKIQGRRLFVRYCASCHSYGYNDELGVYGRDSMTGDRDDKKISASDLKGFASQKWLEEFFNPKKIQSHQYFGGTMFSKGTMSGWVKDTEDAELGLDEKGRKDLGKVILALTAEADLPYQQDLPGKHGADIEAGRQLIITGDLPFDCIDCHKFNGKGGKSAPDLTGYGSQKWLVDLLRDPVHVGYKNKAGKKVKYNMPAFGDSNILDAKSIEFLARWLRKDWPRVGDKKPEAEKDPSKPQPPLPPKGDTQNTSGAKTDPKETSGTKPNSETGTKTDIGAPDHSKPVVTPLPAVGESIDFAKHIKPIFENSCTKCHGADLKKAKGKYRMGDRASASKGSDDEFPAIVPGKSAESELYRLITSDDEDELMPQPGKSPPLSKEQIELIKRWIDDGAKWPVGEVPKTPAK